MTQKIMKGQILMRSATHPETTEQAAPQKTIWKNQSELAA